MAHEWDYDCVCIRCGLDGAEWWHLEHTKEPENREPMPPCKDSVLFSLVTC
jgi:hypothetical protein